MHFDLTDTQRMLRDTCKDFADKELVPNARKWDEEQTFPKEAVQKLGELGLMGICVPEEWGGAGADSISYALAMEEISRGCASTGVIMSVNNSLYCDPVLRFGNDEQKERWLAPFAAGEKLGCFGLTEPEAGSDASAQKTVAIRDGDDFLITGSKNWITNGPQADAMVLFAMTDREKGNRGISAFVVDLDEPGITRAPADRKLGITASGSCSLFFENVRVPASQLLGKEGEGFKVAMATLDGGRIGIAAQALGIARAAYELALAYSKERKSFDQPIANHQAISFMLADMATELEAARLLVLRAAGIRDEGRRHSAESAMAKLYASEMSHRVTHKAIQIHGGYGYSKEYDVERHYRDSRITEIYEGTSEIQRIVISAAMLKG